MKFTPDKNRMTITIRVRKRDRHRNMNSHRNINIEPAISTCNRHGTIWQSISIHRSFNRIQPNRIESNRCRDPINSLHSLVGSFICSLRHSYSFVCDRTSNRWICCCSCCLYTFFIVKQHILFCFGPPVICHLHLS